MASANAPVPIVLCGAKVALGLESANFMKPEFEGTSSMSTLFVIFLIELESDTFLLIGGRGLCRDSSLAIARAPTAHRGERSWDAQLQFTSESYSIRSHLHR